MSFQCSGRKQVLLIQQQACILSAAPMASDVTLTPPAPSGTSAGAADNEMCQRRLPSTGLILVAKFIKVNGSEEGLISWWDKKKKADRTTAGTGCTLSGVEWSD